MTSTSDSDSAAPAPLSPLPRVPVTLDDKGWVRISKEQRRRILTESERSGISATEFTTCSSIKYTTFVGWVQRHRRANSKLQPRTTRLLEAVVEQAQLPVAAHGTALVLELPGGAQAELSDPKQVPLAAAFFHALSKSC